MKTFRLIAAALIFAAVPAISAFAQTGAAAQNTATGKVVVVDTEAFAGTDEKGTGGVAKYVAGLNQVNKEFLPAITEIQNMGAKYDVLLKEYQNLANKPNPQVPVAPETVQAKADQLTSMKTEIERKQEDLKARASRRQEQIMIPINQDIGKAMKEFAKQKGYSMMFDVSKLANAGVILALDDKADVTNEFIAYYNARPATTATTAKP